LLILVELMTITVYLLECDVIDLYMSEITFTCSNRHLRDVIDLYMSELTVTC
jgi:hypothetical protein